MLYTDPHVCGVLVSNAIKLLKRDLIMTRHIGQSNILLGTVFAPRQPGRFREYIEKRLTESSDILQVYSLLSQLPIEEIRRGEKQT